MHCQPSPLTQLITLLTNEEPNPTQLEITILPDRIYNDKDDKNDDDDSDYYFLKDGIHLGIHAPNLPTLARIFREEYYSLRKSLLPFISRKDHENDEIPKLWEATSGLLLLCPDHATAWSDRKRMLLFFIGKNDNDNDSLWKQEIEYLNLLFSQHSKA